MDAIYQGTVHAAFRKSTRVQVRAASPAQARKLIKADFPYSTRVTDLIKIRDLPAAD